MLNVLQHSLSSPFPMAIAIYLLEVTIITVLMIEAKVMMQATTEKSP